MARATAALSSACTATLAARSVRTRTTTTPPAANDERSASGVIELTQDSRLSAAAEAHAVDMVDNNYLSHTDLTGGGPGDRAAAVGYDWNLIAENIAQGFYSNAAVIDAWMNSPGHRANMLDARIEDFGIARVDSTWVLMLGREFD